MGKIRGKVVDTSAYIYRLRAPCANGKYAGPTLTQDLNQLKFLGLGCCFWRCLGEKPSIFGDRSRNNMGEQS